MFRAKEYFSVLQFAKYVIQQFFWFVAITAQLISAMGVGIKWIFMTIRCISFALLDIPFFLPHIIWYLTTSTIIRRVAYRSSQKTKVRNLEKILTDEYMFIHTSASLSLTALPKDSHINGEHGSTAAAAAAAANLSKPSKSPKINSVSHAETVDSWVQSSRRNSSLHHPKSPATAMATTSPTAARTATEDATTADMICSINPADGTYANGIPVSMNLADSDTHAIHDNTIEEALMILQKRYRCSSKAHAEGQQRQTNQGSASVTTTTSASTVVDDKQGQAIFTSERMEKDQGGSDQQPPQHSHSDSSGNANNNKNDNSIHTNASTPAAEPLKSTVKTSGAISESATTDEDDDEDEEDRLNVHNRATLDIVLPVPLDTLFRFMQQDRFPFTLQRTQLRRRKFPVVILINGGAWIIGCYLWNVFLARVLASRGYLVFCPDYRNFPQTTMEGMVLDVSDAIAWVLNNAERYNGDLADVTVLGQSAGAHLTMMSIISQAQMAAHQFNTDVNKETVFHAAPPSPVAYNVPRYNPQKSIRCYIGLSGIYNVRNMVKHFDRRGLYRNVLYQIAGHRKDLPRYTVSCYFDEFHKHETGEELPDNFFDFMPRCMYFLHGDKDKSAPVTESANLVYMMRSAQRDRLLQQYERHNGNNRLTIGQPINVEFILIPGATHTDGIIEEPIYAQNSHVVEFMSLYKCVDVDVGSNSQAGSVSNHSTSSARERRVLSKINDHEIDTVLDAASPVIPINQPDNIFIAPVPHSSRPKLMRLASWICPF